jgi:hypothetical protein
MAETTHHRTFRFHSFLHPHLVKIRPMLIKTQSKSSFISLLLVKSLKRPEKGGESRRLRWTKYPCTFKINGKPKMPGSLTTATLITVLARSMTMMRKTHNSQKAWEDIVFDTVHYIRNNFILLAMNVH